MVSAYLAPMPAPRTRGFAALEGGARLDAHAASLVSPRLRAAVAPVRLT